MTTFVDSNIPMYLVGADHPHKIDAQRLLERLALDDERLVSNAEVLQEILHRYVAIGRKDAIAPAIAALLAVVDEVLPVTEADALLARDLVLASRNLGARDAIHAAVMRRNGIERILSFDKGFDALPGITRVH